ncbi:MAG: alpha/beta hydrolase [Methyloversatilis sp.]|nr:alpha/beta hydrolase [Methyloversatilis sp.]
MSAVGLAAAALLCIFDAQAGPLRERLAERRAESGAEVRLPAGSRAQRNIAYGEHADQRMDVYMPDGARDAPVLFLVHGGGWRRGDKAHGRLIGNKLAHWLPAGVIVVSVNYRMLPDADVLTQRDDVVAALVKAQSLAPTWGGDPSRFVLMGHSAGAHLVALLAASPRGDLRWLGSVLLDSGALDVERLMKERHAGLFDDAFGKDPAFWRVTSPLHQLAAPTAPWLAVCSSRRRQACDQVKVFAQRVRETGGRIDELPLDLSHGAINEQLGLPGDYTRQVDTFLRDIGALK